MSNKNNLCVAILLAQVRWRRTRARHANINARVIPCCSRYADHVGIHYVLCNKLRQFPYEDIEFFLPQLCHLIISVDNESMALEEFLLDLCEESVTAALLVGFPDAGHVPVTEGC